MMKLILICLLMLNQASQAASENAGDFLKRKSLESKPQATFNEYEDIISGSIAFVIGNLGYFSTNSNTLKIAYSGVQTVGIIAIGHGIYDYYYPHFESRLLGLLNQKKLTREGLADGYVSLLGEINRAKRLSLLWSSSLLTTQYALNAFVSRDVPQDMKDIYLFLGGVNAIIAVYSYLNISDYEQYYLDRQNKPKFGLFILPEGEFVRTGVGMSYAW